MRRFYLILALFLVVLPFIGSSQIVINEFQASNASTIGDLIEVDDFSDWIELFNTTATTFDISGWYLTDNTNNPEKWQFPSGTTMAPNSFLFIWADGYEDTIEQSFYSLHTNFKLAKDGEEIALFDNIGKLINKIEYGFLHTDVSYGRKPNGTDSWYYFGTPTPNQSNSTDELTEQNFTDNPIFKTQGGFYNGTVTVEIEKANENQIIKYTTDCSIPTDSSETYNQPITIDSTMVIRVRAFENGFIPSQTFTQSYFIDIQNNALPIISLVGNPDNLWSSNGIYLHSTSGMEIPGNFEYYDEDFQQQIAQGIDFRITGQASNRAPQKPFTLSAKNKYDEDIFQYSFFKNRNVNAFTDLYLRNSGTPDNFYTLFRDGMTHSLVINETDVDCQAYQPTIVYLNGEYWGIYNIRDKINEDYFSIYHNANKDNIDILEYQWSATPVAIEGKADNFYFLLDFMRNNSAVEEGNFNFIASEIDIPEFTDYQITEIFIDNVDWIQSNTKIWKENTYGSKWRYVLLDTDISFGLVWNSYDQYKSYYYHNNLIDAAEFSILKKLLQNEEYKNYFIGRFSVLLNTIFDSTRTLNLIDSLYWRIHPEMPKHIDRWGKFHYSYNGDPISSMDEWNTDVDIMREFAQQRVPYQQQHIIDYFNLRGIDTLQTIVTNSNTGIIQINEAEITSTSAKGAYFLDIPIHILAVPKPGYQFSGWNSEKNTNPDTTLIFTDKTTLIANFTPIPVNLIPDTIFSSLSLQIENSPYIILNDVVIMPNAKLSVDAGVKIKLGQKSNIWVFGSLLLNGEKDLPIKLLPNYENGALLWGGICFENGTEPSILKHVNLESSSQVNITKHFSGISSYHTTLTINNLKIESQKQPFYSEFGKIRIENCYFHSDVASDLVNIKYAELAVIENSTFIGNETVDADAIDYDNLSNGVIRGNRITGFIGFNSDAIDLGENAQNILIEDNYIAHIADKGISVGQASTATVKNNIFINCLQGLGIKDYGSHAIIDKCTFYANGHAVACFEKNYGDGGGSAKIQNSIIANSISGTFFIDELSDIESSFTLSNTETIIGEGNIYDEPDFVNEIAYNFELTNTSPCINAGNPESTHDDDGSIIDLGAKYTYSLRNQNMVLINEINFNSSIEMDSDDWIELYNTTDSLINLAGWSFQDEKFDHLFTIPDGIQLEPNSYFVLCRNDSSFLAQNTLTTNYLGSFEFGLSNNSETIRLFDANLNLINQVEYNDSTPWPTNSDGTGYTLELIAENLDNKQAYNWRTSPYIKGSPGQSNNPELIPDFNYEVIGECTGLVIFANNSVGFYDSIMWDFGDEYFDNLNNTEHAYTEPGNFTVTLHIYSYFGHKTIEKELSFNQILTPPITLADSSCEQTSLVLTANASGEVIWYENRFDEEAIFTGNIFETPILKSSKTFYVANYKSGCESKRSEVTATIFNTLTAYFGVDETNGLIATTNNSANAISYLWDFGDGTQSNEFEPMHQYTQIGSYTIRLTASNDFCNTVDDNTRTIEINSIEFTEINEVEDLFAIYPNPAKDYFYIDFGKQKFDQLFIKIHNLYGQEIVVINTKTKLQNNKTLINTNHLQQGVYLVSIWIDGKLTTQKIIIN